MKSLPAYLADLQKTLLPGVAARGQSLARSGAVVLDRVAGGAGEGEPEIRLRVRSPSASAAVAGNLVTLWPEAEDQYCDCEEASDPCTHVAAAVASLRLGLVDLSASRTSGGLRYMLVQGTAGTFGLERRIGDQRLEGPLLAQAGLIPSEADLRIDRAIAAGASLATLLPLLKEAGGVEWEGRILSIGNATVAPGAQAGGVAVIGDQLCPVVGPAMSPSGAPGIPSGNPASLKIRLDEEGGRLSVVAQILVEGGDGASVSELRRILQQELQLAHAHRVFLDGMAAVEFCSKVAALSGRLGERMSVVGNGAGFFSLQQPLVPRVEWVSSDSGGDGLCIRLDFGKVATSQVFEAWNRGESHVRLLGGGFAPLPVDWLARYGATLTRLIALQEKRGGRLPSGFKPELVALAGELGFEIPAGFDRFERIERAALPADLNAELRSYQQAGVDWLVFARESGLGALLADDMGLGKTLQALCAIEGRTLVVAPMSVLEAWRSQIARFRPSLKVSVYAGPGRRLDPHAAITLTTYGVLRADAGEARELGGVRWNTVVLDEAQTIKNPDSQVARAAHALQGGFRIALSGTPVENRLEDLWSQFEFLNPGLLGTRHEFQAEWAGPIARGDLERQQRLARRIKPLILRRMKHEVAPELPPKTELVLQCELSEPERELYEALLVSSRRQVLEALQGPDQKQGGIFGALELLLRLRQAACHPWLAQGQPGSGAPGASSKIQLLMEQLVPSLEQGHRALIFSQWTGFLDLIEPVLREAGIPFLRLDGSTEDRGEVVERFQSEGGPPVLLLSLRAGGVGITLTRADQVYLMDSWWNPAVEEQAADRAYRIGQKNPVFVYRLVARDTVEEKILALQQAKKALSSSLVSGSQAGASLTREDLMALLS